MNYYSLLLKNLNNNILNCPNRINSCGLQIFPYHQQDISPYPEIIWVGKSYGELQNIPKIMFIGISPRHTDNPITTKKVDAGTRMASTLSLKHRGWNINPLDPNSIIPNLNDVEYLEIVKDFEEITKDYDNGWSINGLKSFTHYTERKYHQILQKFFDISFRLNPEIIPQDLCAITNFTICGGKLPNDHVSPEMMNNCLNQGYLNQAILTLKPDVVFFLGHDSFHYFKDEIEDPSIQIINNNYHNNPSLGLISIDNKFCLIQRIPYFDHFAPNDSDFEGRTTDGDDALLILLDELAIDFLPEFQRLFPNYS